MKLLALGFVLAVLAVPLAGQEPLTEHTLALPAGARGAEASIEDFAWLAGRWTGEGLGGWTEELWSPPDGGTMMGVFRLLREGKPVFYEMLTIADFGEGFAMRLKHFHPDMKGWEEREEFVQFRYIGVIDGVVHFSGLAFERDGENAMTIYLALRRDGEVREHTFHMARAPHS